MDENFNAIHVANQLSAFCKTYSLESLFIVGEFCRYLHANKLQDLERIEVCSAFEDQVIILGRLFSTEIMHRDADIDEDNNTVTIVFGDNSIQFQGYSTRKYLRNAEIKQWFQDNRIPDLPLMNNIYSGRFTFNALIYSPIHEKIYDPLKVGVEDLSKKIIRSILPPDLLIKYDPEAILETMNLAMEEDFHIDSSLKSAIKKQSDVLVKCLSRDTIRKELLAILGINTEKALKVVEECGLENLLLSEEVKDYLGDYYEENG